MPAAKQAWSSPAMALAVMAMIGVWRVPPACSRRRISAVAA
jgi:hypothetical protein